MADDFSTRIDHLHAEYQASRAGDPTLDAVRFATERCGGDERLRAAFLARVAGSPTDSSAQDSSAEDSSARGGSALGGSAPSDAPAGVDAAGTARPTVAPGEGTDRLSHWPATTRHKVVVPQPGGTVRLSDDAPADPEAGRRIDGRYVVERRLGEGGFGVVYLVRDDVHKGNLRALKTLRAALVADQELVQRFRNEIVTLKAVAHRNVPKFHGDGRTDEGDLYYVMDYVDGARLDEILKAEGPMAPDRIVRLVRQVLEVLDYAHEKGVYHRDLKPANLILVKAGTPDEEVRVLDFGIAKIDSDDEEFSEIESLHTMQGGAIGTPHYMAPEQVDGRGGIDGKTDLYALGVIIYQMCSGRVPFTGKTSMEIAAARLTQAPPPLEQSTPEWLRSLVMRLLERQKERRPGTRELRLELDHLARGQRDIKRLMGWIAAGILVVALGVAFLVWRDAQVERQRRLAGVERNQGRGAGEQAPPTRGAGARAQDSGQEGAPERAPQAPPVGFLSPPEGLRSASPEIEVVLDARERQVVVVGDREVQVGADGVARTTMRLPADQSTTIVVRDLDGAQLASRSVHVDGRAPRIEVAPPDGVKEQGSEWLVARRGLVLRGRVDDGPDGALAAKPIALVGGEAQALDAGGGFQIDLELAEGRQDVALRAVDATGQASVWTRTVVVDASAPRIVVSTSSEARTGDRVRFEGRVEDATASSARIVRDGAPQPLALDAEGRFAVDLPLAVGLNEYVIEAQDALGNAGSSTWRVERLRDALKVVSLAPESGRALSARDASVRVSASTSQRPSKVEVQRGGAALQVSAELRADGFDVALPLAFGSNQFRLVVHDEQGVPGPAQELVYLRAEPATPAGCVLPADVALDAEGRPTTVLHERSGLELVLVPAAGSAPAFYASRHEATIGAVRRVREGFYDEPERASEIWDRVPRSQADAHPAILATFDEAKALCRDWGLRLPTTAEWDALAGAGDGRAYPWGSDWIAGACNADQPEDPHRYTAPVGGFPRDRAPCGALDVAGNVSEWCVAGDKPALRGGNWYSSAETCKLQHARNPPAKRSDYVGFRPVLDAPAVAR